jgi:branched-chain amino acid transport system permease protein
METFMHQVLSGLATGGIYASIALALVMIYQATNLVNFAQGEMAMFSTYIAWSLIEGGLPYWERLPPPSRSPSSSASSSSG